MYGLVWQLAGAQISTKESLEDCLADLTDTYSRDRKGGGGKDVAPERLFLRYTMSERLRADYLQLNVGDFQSAKARAFSADREAVFGDRTKSTCGRSAVIDNVRMFCKEGWGSLSNLLRAANCCQLSNLKLESLTFCGRHAAETGTNPLQF